LWEVRTQGQNKRKNGAEAVPEETGPSTGNSECKLNNWICSRNGKSFCHVYRLKEKSIKIDVGIAYFSFCFEAGPYYATYAGLEFVSSCLSAGFKGVYHHT
jgi:hypothetical protein